MRIAAGVAFALLVLALLFAVSPKAGLAVAGIFVPVALGTAVLAAGIARRLAPWPWLAGLGIAFVPACWMASVKLCEGIAGACVTGDELSHSRQAVVSVVAFLAATGLLALPRTPARHAAFAGLVLLGQGWLLLKLLALDEVPPAVLIVVLVALEIGYEVTARIRAPRATASA